VTAAVSWEEPLAALLALCLTALAHRAAELETAVTAARETNQQLKGGES
jgi:hypothetical protein